MFLADKGKHRAPSIPDLLTVGTGEKAGFTMLAVNKAFDLITEITEQPLERLLRWMQS